MIPNIEQIKAEYRASDFNRRLHLYLQFPPLRTKFLAIDQSELTDRPAWQATGRRTSLAARFSVMLSTTTGYFRRLF